MYFNNLLYGIDTYSISLTAHAWQILNMLSFIFVVTTERDIPKTRFTRYNIT